MWNFVVWNRAINTSDKLLQVHSEHWYLSIPKLPCVTSQKIMITLHTNIITSKFLHLWIYFCWDSNANSFRNKSSSRDSRVRKQVAVVSFHNCCYSTIYYQKLSHDNNAASVIPCYFTQKCRMWMTTSIIKAPKFFNVECPLSFSKCEFRQSQTMQNIKDKRYYCAQNKCQHGTTLVTAVIKVMDF
jgi:hypothetical protein